MTNKNLCWRYRNTQWVFLLLSLFLVSCLDLTYNPNLGEPAPPLPKPIFKPFEKIEGFVVEGFHRYSNGLHEYSNGVHKYSNGIVTGFHFNKDFNWYCEFYDDRSFEIPPFIFLIRTYDNEGNILFEKKIGTPERLIGDGVDSQMINLRYQKNTRLVKAFSLDKNGNIVKEVDQIKVPSLEEVEKQAKDNIRIKDSTCYSEKNPPRHGVLHL